MTTVGYFKNYIMLFLTNPRLFTNVDNTTYEIGAISAKINNTKEVIVGSNNSVSFEFTFYEIKEQELKARETLFRDINKDYDIPNVGVISMVGGLLSSDKNTVFNMASILCNYYGYTLKPFEEQIFLN